MNAPALAPAVQGLIQYESAFNKQNGFGLKFETECLFAKQQLMKNDFTMKMANNNQNSLKSAILNVAAIGISLNPASAHAYLVPRDGAICLDLSYRGIVKLATDCGAIAWAKAELVYEGDTFEWLGMTQIPVHTFDPFDPDRMDAKQPLANLRGGYCVAQLADGTYLVDRMTAGEIVEIKNSSKAKGGPWAGKWAGEMAKKTLVKRASKSWPQSNQRERLDKAIELLNEHEGFDDATSQEAEKAVSAMITVEQATSLCDRLLAVGADLPRFCLFMQIDSVATMPVDKLEQAERVVAKKEAACK